MRVEQLGPSPAADAADRSGADDRRRGRTTDAAPRTPRLRPGAVVLVALYALACVGLVRAAWLSRHLMSNIDGISYLSIAQQYADGSVATAVNAFWSPLASWLMAPLLLLGVPGMLAFTLVNAASGVVGVGIGTLLVWRHTRGHAWAAALFLVGSSVFWIACVHMLTPDLLVVTWTILLVGALTAVAERIRSGGRHAAWLGGAALGVVCAVGYVTKLYLVPVMLVAVPLWALLVVWWNRDAGAPRRPDRRIVARVAVALGATVLTACLVAAPWVAALSQKYGYPTIGSSFTVNIEAKFDPTAADEDPQPLRLWAPPNDRAVSYGEDRTSDAAGPGSGSPAPVLERLEYYLSQRIAAFPHYVNRVGTLAPLATTTTAAVVLLVLFGRLRAARYRLPVTAAVVWVVYFAGYAAITTAANGGGSPRYYWPLLPLWLLVVCSLVPAFFRVVDAGGSRWRRVLAVTLVAVVPLSVVWQFGLGRSQPFSTIVRGPRDVVAALTMPDRPTGFEVLAEEHLSQVVRPGDTMVGSNFRGTVQLAYFLGAQVYGRAAQPYDPDDPAFRALLRAHGIDWYLYYSPVAAGEPLPDGLAELGPTAGSWTSTVTCGDTAGAPVEPCTLTLVEVTDP